MSGQGVDMWRAFLENLPTIIAAAAAFIVTLRELRKQHRTMNSKLDQLISAREEVARLTGFTEGRLEERQVKADEANKKAHEHLMAKIQDLERRQRL